MMLANNFFVLILINSVNFVEIYGIIGGTSVKRKDWSFLVALVYENNSIQCSGSLIRNDWVLTSAQCLDPECNFNNFFKAVRLGGYGRKSNEGRYVPYEAFFIHPNYKKKVTNGYETMESNIALIKLIYPVSLSKRIGLVNLAELDLTINTNFITAGWGVTDINIYEHTSNQTYMRKTLKDSRPLLSIRQKITELKWCKNIIQSYSQRKPYLSEKDHFCSYTYTIIDHAGPTIGDMGGPLIYDGEQYGIASHTLFKPNISNYLYTVWQKLDLNWIDKKIATFQNNMLSIRNTFNAYTSQTCFNCASQNKRMFGIYVAIFFYIVCYYILIVTEYLYDVEENK